VETQSIPAGLISLIQTTAALQFMNIALLILMQPGTKQSWQLTQILPMPIAGLLLIALSGFKNMAYHRKIKKERSFAPFFGR